MVRSAKMAHRNRQTVVRKYLKECYQLGTETFGWRKRSSTPGSMKEGAVSSVEEWQPVARGYLDEADFAVCQVLE